MLMPLSFDWMYEDDLECGLQPFLVSYKDQQTIANQDQVNKDYNMIQQGAAPQLQDLYVLKEVSKILVPTTKQQMMRTLKAFMVLLYTVLGPNNTLSIAFRQEIVDQYDDSIQFVVETYVSMTDSINLPSIITRGKKSTLLTIKQFLELSDPDDVIRFKGEDGDPLSDINQLPNSHWIHPAIKIPYLCPSMVSLPAE
jgi:hypothetical protein